MAIATTPSRSGAVAATPSKPRLLYRGPLRLADGTLLPGIAFVSTFSPFEPTPGGTEAAQSHDAEICLALEMVRGKRVVGIHPLDRASLAGNPSMKDYESYLEASGQIKAYIDPREHFTASFFERHFCWQEDWSDPSLQQSHAAFSLTLDSTFEPTGEATRDEQQSTSTISGASSVQSQDPFLSSYSQSLGGTSGPSATSFERNRSVQLVLFARMSDDLDAAGRPGLDIVVGRKITRKKPKVSSTSAPLFARPDDPLPRASGLAGRILSQRNSFSRGMTPTEVLHNDLPLESAMKENLAHRRQWQKTKSMPQQLGRAPSRERSVSIECDVKAAPVNGAAGAAPGGNHTPGRRGEKRHRLLAASSSAASHAALLASPTKRKRADEMDLSPAKSRGGASLSKPKSKSAVTLSTLTKDEPESAVTSSKSKPAKLSLDRVRGRSITPSLLSTATTPEPPDPALLENLPIPRTKSSSFTHLMPPSAAPNLSSSSMSAHSPCSPYGPLEACNRHLIKRLIQHQLLGRGLEKGDADFDRCLLAAYNGVVVVLRNVVATVDLDTKIARTRVADLVMRHLNMYLDEAEEVQKQFSSLSSSSSPSSSTPSTFDSGAAPAMMQQGSAIAVPPLQRQKISNHRSTSRAVKKDNADGDGDVKKAVHGGEGEGGEVEAEEVEEVKVPRLNIKMDWSHARDGAEGAEFIVGGTDAERGAEADTLW